MTSEQCMCLEIETLKACTKNLLMLNGVEEFRIEEIFEHVHDLAWCQHVIMHDLANEEEN